MKLDYSSRRTAEQESADDGHAVEVGLGYSRDIPIRKSASGQGNCLHENGACAHRSDRRRSTYARKPNSPARFGPTRRSSFGRIVAAYQLPVALLDSLTIRYVVPVHAKGL
jgi:hypothetical protein